MAASVTSVPVLGEYTLDTVRGRLLRAGRPVHLRPQAYRALTYLVEHRGRLLSKAELIDKVWEGRAVTDDSIVQCLRDIRQALGDIEGRYLRTERGRGYIFDWDANEPSEISATHPVTQVPTDEASFPPPDRSSHRRSTRPAALMTLAAIAAISLLLAGVWRLSYVGASGVTAPTFLKLTSSLDLDLWPSLSPDGEWLAYSATKSWGTIGEQIYLQAVGGLTPICLTCDETGPKISPVFSPDGARIAFSSGRRGGGIFIMAKDGSSPRRLTSRGFQPTWSPDGTEIAFSTRRTDWIPAEPYFSTSELWVVNVASGQTRRLEVTDGRDPAWSPDGRWIAFWTRASRGWDRDVFTIPAAGGAVRRVTPEATDDWNPTWASDGGALYFSSNRDGTRGLWRVPIDPGSGGPAAPAQAVSLPTAFVTYPRSGPKGMVVYSDATAESDVSLLSFEPATAAIIGPPRPVTTGTRFWLPPHPSSGGQWVALAQAAIADHEDIFSVGRDGTSLRRLTDDVFHDRDPQVSPDGQRVAFASDRGGRWGIWTIGADGGHLAPVSAPDATRAWTRPHWSPDGASIAAWEEPGHRTVIFDAARTTSTPRTILPPVPGAPTESLSQASDQRAWSANGGLAVQADSVLAIYSFDTGGYRTTPMDGAILGWIPDTPLLLLNHGSERRFTLVDTTTWRTTAIAYPSFIPEGDVRFGLSPDGRTLALVHATYKGDIWLMRTHVDGYPPK